MSQLGWKGILIFYNARMVNIEATFWIARLKGEDGLSHLLESWTNFEESLSATLLTDSGKGPDD